MKTRNNKNSNRKRFYEVYLIPVIVVMFLITLSYFSSTYFQIDRNEIVFDYFIALTIGVFLSFRNRFNWIPSIKGSYVRIKKINQKRNTIFIKEPLSYEAEFNISIGSKIVTPICGLLAIIGGFYIFKHSGILLSITLVFIGCFTFYIGVQELTNIRPKLKLSKDGLWTKELGFQPWSYVEKTTLKKEKGRYIYHTNLEIYLKGNSQAYPDQSFSIDDIEGKEKIKPIIDKLSQLRY